MGLSYARKKEIAALRLPEDSEITRQAKDYMATTGLSLTAFARHVGCADNTLSCFFNGTYQRISGTSKNVGAKIMKFIDAHPAGIVERAKGKLYDTENVVTLRHWFRYSLEHSGERDRIICVYGGPGSQKTFVAEHLVDNLNRQELSKNGHGARAFHIYCSQDITPSELVRKVMCACALPSNQRIQQNLASLRIFFRSRKVVFLFDEAQHLGISCLEIVREMQDQRPHFGIMLLGSHKLREFFTNRAAELEQWNSRMTAVIELPGISEERAAEIVRTELNGVKEYTATKMRVFLKACMATDIYSGRRAVQYLSARKLFNSIETFKQNNGISAEVTQ